MSEYLSEPWMAELWLDPQWIVTTKERLSIVLCVTSHGDDEVKARRIVADHNGCLGIDDPETTVPELVAVTRKTEAWLQRRATHCDAEAAAARSGYFPKLAESNEADAKNYRAVARDLHNVLASTGQKRD